VKNKKHIKEEGGKDEDKERKENKCAKSRLMNKWIDQEQEIVKQEFEYDQV
jgi:hypothetical protein